MKLRTFWAVTALLDPPLNIYRPLTKLREGYVFTGVCDSVHRGGVHVWLLWGHTWLLGGMCGCSREGAWLLLGGMFGCCQKACVVAPGGGYVWLLWGSMCGCFGGHVWLLLEGYVVAPRRHAWLLLGGAWDMTRYGDTINKRAVCILLECILVKNLFSGLIPQTVYNLVNKLNQ